MTRQQTLADAVLESRALITRYFKGFDDSNHTSQAVNLPNHFAWTLGHLALTMHRAADRFVAPPAELPETDFLTGDGASGTRDRFDSESVCFASVPSADASRYPSCDRCIEICNHAAARLAAAVRNADDRLLDSETDWGTARCPLWSTAVRMVFHTGTHCGQLADLRRALGLGSIFA
jgi:hypothetical protein